MKIPQKFIPKKYSESKIKKLLEKKISEEYEAHKRDEELYQEVKSQFPQFVEYLTNLYLDFDITKVQYKGRTIWGFYEYQRNPIPKKPDSYVEIYKLIGSANKYMKEVSKDVSEYGREGKVLIEEEWRELKYREGYHCFDNMRVIISTKDPYRYDMEPIPFP